MIDKKRIENDQATSDRRDSEDKDREDNRERNDDLTTERRSKADEEVEKQRLRNDKTTVNRRYEKDRVATVKKRRDFADTIGIIVIAFLVFILFFGGLWSVMSLNKQYNEINLLNQKLTKLNSDNIQLSQANKEVCGLKDTNPPTILYISPLNDVSPANNKESVSTNIPITVMFSEDMDPSTINEETFTVMQRTTPDTKTFKSLTIAGTITYSERKATFISNDRFQPNQIYGNVFTVTISDEVKDLAGNSLVNKYIWSFTTGEAPFNTGATTSQTN